MPTLDGVTVEATGAVVTLYSIEPMTADLFGFWLDYDWDEIVQELDITVRSSTKPTLPGQYLRDRVIVWNDINNSPVHHGLTLIMWAQIRPSYVQLEVLNGGPLLERLVDWIKWRLGITTNAEDKKKSSFSKKQNDDNLTKAQRRIASYLAGGLSYADIAKLTGLKTLTVKTHAQAIAKQWNIRAVPELLIREAQSRGFTLAE